MARLPMSTWSSAEARTLSSLRSLGRMWVTGGWVRDKLLECTDVNPQAGRAWQRLRRLTGNPAGDLDVLVDGISARDFHAACHRSETMSSVLRRLPVLVPARGGRSLDIVKLRLPQHCVDVTSLPDAQRLLGVSGSSGALLKDAEHRDASFNALYYDPTTEEVLDPSTLGIADLRAAVVRVPHSGGAAASIEEDPVRLLRVFRFASRFEFELDDDIRAALGEANGSTWATNVAEHLGRSPPGRLLNEVKKALLLHNRPSGFLGLLGGVGDVHRFFFGQASDSLVEAWPAAVGRVRRLEALVLEGLDRQLLTSRSSRWRGRRADGPPPALCAPDWRKTGVWENDWAELLLAALLWCCDKASLERIGAGLQLSLSMIDNVVKLQEQARHNPTAAHTAPPGAHLLKAAVASHVSAADFWDRWPQKKIEQPAFGDRRTSDGYHSFSRLRAAGEPIGERDSWDDDDEELQLS
eukprot:CAMPEP_0171065402 /NCGR_PEP_ID=MMETSP0766_2-20121228/6822_1 /TAXON_ID=439317 /ORGANISM="Gambierdiscus australes, Strain CAWD 149" /LENGTH=466 /DNA_ID=CAMNT_0011521499 /DNA_START=64 /DNA_END=1460 /DNA_ORIENTATION=-